MRIIGGLLTAAAVVAFVLGLSWVTTGNSLAIYRYFNPKFEQVRRETFEQSKAYNEAMIRDLQKLQLEYVEASESGKVIISDTVLHRTADFDIDDRRVPSQVREFVKTLRSARLQQR